MKRLIVGISGASGRRFMACAYYKFCAMRADGNTSESDERAARQTLALEFTFFAARGAGAGRCDARCARHLPPAFPQALTRRREWLSCPVRLKRCRSCPQLYDGLLTRAADVILKRAATLWCCVCARNAALHIEHLRLMTRAAEIRRGDCTASSSFYHLHSDVR